MHISQKRKLQLIDSILAKPLPDNGVTRIGPEVDLVDVKVLKFFQEDEQPWLLVEARDGTNLICSTWNGRTHTGRQTHPIKDFSDNHFKITHYYGSSTIYFESLSDYARAQLLKIPYALIYIKQKLEFAGTVLYNRSRMVLYQRLELLTFMIEQAAEGKHSFDPIDLMTDMHTVRWVSHPDGEQVFKRLELYLDALVDTGELIKINSNYVLTGHALRLVEECSEQERKHKQDIKIQRTIAALTLCTAILTFVQAGFIKINPFIDLTK